MHNTYAVLYTQAPLASTANVSADEGIIEEFPAQPATLVSRPLEQKPIYYHNNDTNSKP
jgi:hypothetical protein